MDVDFEISGYYNTTRWPLKKQEDRMFNYNQVTQDVLWRISQERHADLLQAAQARRLVKNPSKKLKSRLMVNTGDLLIALGLRLKARQKMALPKSS